MVDHPLVQHKLTIMRQKTTPVSQFRSLLAEIGMLMGYEITRDLPLVRCSIETPVAATEGVKLATAAPAVIPVLRAGLGMTEGLLQLIPDAVVGHIGVYRDESTRQPKEYLVRLPEIKDRYFLVVDPMLATGGSAVHAIDVLIQGGVAKNRIRFMCLVAAPEGVAFFHQQHPDIPIITASLDECLNAKAYIVPGLGDAGDRIFGT
ncbi:MAG: uracil phosphoribosyltransferase [Leptospiraceae bacterium]|nr:uracil phosphoribosyltransferase [Leptospiraceae bacterium]